MVWLLNEFLAKSLNANVYYACRPMQPAEHGSRGNKNVSVVDEYESPAAEVITWSGKTHPDL